MPFDGIKSTNEPKAPEEMTALRLAVGYNTYGTPVVLVCDSRWEFEGLKEKCECGYGDCDESEVDNSSEIPVGHVQRIVLFVPSVAPAAKVTKALDLSRLIVANESPVKVEVATPAADGSRRRDDNLGFGPRQY